MCFSLLSSTAMIFCVGRNYFSGLPDGNRFMNEQFLSGTNLNDFQRTYMKMKHMLGLNDRQLVFIVTQMKKVATGKERIIASKVTRTTIW